MSLKSLSDKIKDGELKGHYVTTNHPLVDDLVTNGGFHVEQITGCVVREKVIKKRGQKPKTIEVLVIVSASKATKKSYVFPKVDTQKILAYIEKNKDKSPYKDMEKA